MKINTPASVALPGSSAGKSDRAPEPDPEPEDIREGCRFFIVIIIIESLFVKTLMQN